MYEKYQKKLESLLDTKLENTEKINFNKIKDVTKLYTLIKKVKDSMDVHLSRAKRLAIVVDTEIKSFNKLAGDIERASKELGIPIKDINLQKLFNDLKKFKKEADSVLDA